MMQTPRRHFWLLSAGLALGAFALATAAGAQPLAGPALIAALRGGGYVLLMRHASSPRTPPDPAAADKANVAPERQLDDAGRASARAMGEALASLRIPIGRVLSSPTYRALETIRLARLGQPTVAAELGDGGQSMQAGAVASSADWLRRKIAEAPPAGANTIIVTHFPNIASVFGDQAQGLADGEALVLRPDGKGAAPLVARVKIEQWPLLARSSP